jgi:hypothetical protein
MWAVVFTAGAALFLWVSSAVVIGGVGHADDAWNALVARTLASGQGYGRPFSSADLIPFDPRTTTGLTFTIPAAVAMALLGPLDEIPGAVMLVIFAGQIALAAVLLRRRFSAAATLSFLAVVVLLLMLVRLPMWFFGVAVGETEVFGFLMLAIVALATFDHRRGVSLAGVFAGLAIVTKLVALVSAFGLWLVYGALVWRALGSREAARRVAWLSLGVTIPVGFVEALKLGQLGLSGYIAWWSTTAQISGSTGTAPARFADRPWVLLSVFDSNFFPLVTLAVLIAGAAFVFLRERLAAAAPWPPRTPLALALGALGAHLVWFVLVSTLYPRYLWVGFALGMLAIACVMLVARPRARAFVLAGVIAVSLVSGSLSFDVPGTMAAYGDASQEHAERLAVVAALEQRPTTPFVAEWWSSLYDIVYLRPSAGTWAYGLDIARFQGQPVVALIDGRLTDVAGAFYTAVTARCIDLTPGQARLSAYRCESPFWAEFLPNEPLTSMPPRWLVEGTFGAGGRCNIDIADGHAPPPATLIPRDLANIWLAGWAVDPSAARSPDATYVVLRAAGASYYAPTVTGRRPEVAQALAHPGWDRAGFRASLSANGLAHGNYAVGLVTLTQGVLRACRTSLQIRL